VRGYINEDKTLPIFPNWRWCCNSARLDRLNPLIDGDMYERLKVRRWGSYWMASLVSGRQTSASCVP
jgi:hypothetical protein